MAMQRKCFREETDRAVKKELGDKAADYLEDLPSFYEDYQPWYTEATKYFIFVYSTLNCGLSGNWPELSRHL
jgi:hypothetical protein